MVSEDVDASVRRAPAGAPQIPMRCDCPHADSKSGPDAESEPASNAARPPLESNRTHHLLMVIEVSLSAATFALSLAVALGWL